MTCWIAAISTSLTAMRGRRSPIRAMIALQLGIALLAAAPAARAQQEDESAAFEGVVGIGSAICTLVYSPLKVAYAIGGSVVSGLAWMWTLGDTSVAGPIFRASPRTSACCAMISAPCPGCCGWHARRSRRYV